MIVMLLGKAGAGKTTIAKAMEKRVKDSFVIDGDELRAETANLDISFQGREANMHLGLGRARRLSDLGFTVFVAMQAPIAEIRNEYLQAEDIQILVTNSGDNPKDQKGYNKNFSPDYNNVHYTVELTKFNVESFYDEFFPKVLVIARFMGFHSGHRVVLEEAKRISPNITVALRVDKDDIIPLEDNIKLLESYGYKVIKSPNLEDDWTEFGNGFDIFVQGNPVIIDKMKNSTCENFFIPRYGSVSGTSIREDIKNNKDVSNKIDAKTYELVKENIV